MLSKFQIIVSTLWEDLTPLITFRVWSDWTQGWANGCLWQPWRAGGLLAEWQPWTHFYTASEEMTELCVLVFIHLDFISILSETFSNGRALQFKA